MCSPSVSPDADPSRCRPGTLTSRGPGWYKNLVAHPDAKIQVWDRVIPVVARTGSAADKRRVWPVMTKQWPGYDGYQAGTKRNIPVVLLTSKR